jgi:hypothetical protein
MGAVGGQPTEGIKRVRSRVSGATIAPRVKGNARTIPASPPAFSRTGRPSTHYSKTLLRRAAQDERSSGLVADLAE